MSLNTSPDMLERVAIQGLRLDPPPTEDDIQEILTGLAAAFEFGPDDIAKAFKSLNARFSNRRQSIKDEHGLNTSPG
jgi:hypothetical protein